eukprot:2155163-Amphidinium_carterae.1
MRIAWSLQVSGVANRNIQDVQARSGIEVLGQVVLEQLEGGGLALNNREENICDDKKCANMWLDEKIKI